METVRLFIGEKKPLQVLFAVGKANSSLNTVNLFQRVNLENISLSDAIFVGGRHVRR